MRFTFCRFALTVTISSVCLAQPWELGAIGGYGWYHDSSMANATGSSLSGIPHRAAFGVTFSENMYNYVGGEIRYLFRFGGPELKSSGMEASLGGLSEVTSQAIGSRAVHRSARLAWPALIELYGDEAVLCERIEKLKAVHIEGNDELLRLAEKYVGGWRPKDFGED